MNDPQFLNWLENIKRGLGKKYFWDEAIYSLRVYNSFSPLMRACVDLRIEGKKNKEIAGLVKKSPDTVKTLLWRAKKKILLQI